MSRRRSSRRLCAAAVVPLFLLAAACGDDGDPGATPESAAEDQSDPATSPESTSPSAQAALPSPADDPPYDDLCRLLPQPVAEQLLGEPLEPGRQFDDECEWETADQDRFIKVSRLDVGGYDWESIEQWSEAQTTGDHQPEPVDLGDEAYFSWISPDLDVRAGEEVYQFEIALDEMSAELDPEADKQAEKDALVAAAQAALERL